MKCAECATLFDEEEFAKIVVIPPAKKAREIVERSKKYSSPSFNRLYRLVVESAHGSIVRDIDGNQFIDFSSGIAVLNTWFYSH